MNGQHAGDRPERTAPQDFFPELVMGYRRAKAVMVAHELGLFAALAAGPRTTAELARELACDERALEALVRAVASIGLLGRDGDRFANAPLAANHLVPGRPGYAGDNLRFQEMLWDCWSSLAEVVRTGRAVHTLDQLLAGRDPGFTRDYIRGMQAVSAAPAREAMRLLADRPVARMLDVGGGPGTFCLAFLEQFPHGAATMIDLPSTLAVTRELLAADPRRERVALVEGDYLVDGFGDGFDLVLLSHVTHDESPESCRAMAARAHAALRPGGRVAIHDFVVDGGGCGPAWSALFSLNLLLYTRGGRVYSVAEYVEQLSAAGFVRPKVYPVLEGKIPNPTVLVVAEKD
jgi:3-hydroxy-5-methyl-1-naphthoate 3-O-methyltransferase